MYNIGTTAKQTVKIVRIYGQVLRNEDDDWVEYELDDPRTRPKSIVKHVN